MKNHRKNQVIVSEKGSVAVFVFITIIVFLAILMGAYLTVTTLRQAQLQSDLRIQEIYGKDVNQVDQVYEEIIAKIPLKVEALQQEGTYMTEMTTVVDDLNNTITIPTGFKIATDSGLTVEEGIVIEDDDIVAGLGNSRGNQYVWIPVGEVKKSDGTTVNITLGRYIYADGIAHTDTDGQVLAKGTPILKQNANNYVNETEIKVSDITPSSTDIYGYKELRINREGVASEGENAENVTVLNLNGFIESTVKNGGYYIARYEASYGVDGKANSKVSDNVVDSEPTTNARTEGMLWNYITQIEAATASREIYQNVMTDLINSYAWDTAIVYIQECSGDVDYSYQDGPSKNTSLTNTGKSNDEVCKINDMASNTRELTTEYSSYSVDSIYYPCTSRGGYFDYSGQYPSSRVWQNMIYKLKHVTFRTILYL